MKSLHPQARRLENRQGQALASYWYAPRGEARGVALLAPAIGVPQRFYRDFAGWLAERGYLAVTFDYRGIGESCCGPLRALEVDILGWARDDCSAVLDAAAEAAGDRPLYWLGHSLGAQIVPLVEGHERIARVITIAAGSGYWRDNSPQIRKQAWLLWHALAPALTPLFGYFPGKRLGAVGDLPAGVIRQWRRWCLHPEYLVGAEGDWMRDAFAAVRTPLVSLSFTDDEMMSARSTASLHGFYVNAPKRMQRLAPQDVGASRIGHFGFFRPAQREALWEQHLLPALAPA